LILTKWDGTAKGGIILSVANETGAPVKLIGVGEKLKTLLNFARSNSQKRCLAEDRSRFW
jgi:signal recognition particle GTPase